MEKKKIAILQGDYSGPEMMQAGLAVLDAVSQNTDFEYELNQYYFGGEAIDAVGEPLPKETVAGCKKADAVLLSAIGGPKWEKETNSPEKGLLQIRNELGLFANIRPTKVIKALENHSPLKQDIISGTDFVIVRELTSGIYFGTPRVEEKDYAVDTTSYTLEEITRILKVGFEMAQRRKKHVTIVDKANVLATSRLWRKTAEKFSQDYPDTTVDYMYVDATAMKIITEPTFFDVIITANLFGDILSDEAAVLTGSLGTIPSASAGTKGPRLYEPIHGSAPTLAKQNKINPLSMIQSIELMLRDSFEREDLANRISRAIVKTIAEGIITADIGGQASTTEMTAAIIENLKG
ncbi:3-isopropylmalate dehydrogenase [Ligilactobacillus sp. WILCCON 0076]|uniref:3-isopropylmalate dehydrogenase n=1 Tax=Ligilactobacillus ubinensis TaxID=2876789 RepID=A0A9X2FH65_9LACO|nr:3-isopropylmalate dehydrogenase [Ligilactobacillus ubinensis]MCP0885800.1 3-isopropylmalate dehydrogenase [Ligilactobacillus ubinensis]